MKTINLPNGIISSEIDIPEDIIKNVKQTLSRSDFSSDVGYNNYLEMKNSLKDFQLMFDDDLVVEHTDESIEIFHDLKKIIDDGDKYK